MRDKRTPKDVCGEAICETAKPWFQNSRPRLQPPASETQNHPKTRSRDQSRTLPRFRDRVKIFRDPRYSRNHSIPPLLSQLLRLPFEGRNPKGFPSNNYFKRLPKETEQKSLKVIRNVFTRDNSTQCSTVFVTTSKM